MKKSPLLSVVCACLLVATFNAKAALIDNGQYTTDTASGLDWLDLTETDGMSFDAVAAQLGAGGLFEGWSFASSVQVTTLFNNAGGVAPYTGWSAINNGVIAPLVVLLGQTTGGSVSPAAAMLMSDQVGSDHIVAFIHDNPLHFESATKDYMDINFMLQPSYTPNIDAAIALIRVSVAPDSDGDGLSDADEEALGTRPDVADTDGDGIEDGSDPDIIATAINALPLDPSVFANRGDPAGHRNAMLSRLIDIQSDIASGIASGDFEQALRALRNLRTRVDGCDTSTGTSPERNDWITDCAAQLEIRRLIDLLITNLES